MFGKSAHIFLYPASPSQAHIQLRVTDNRLISGILLAGRQTVAPSPFVLQCAAVHFIAVYLLPENF